eukprot:1081865-Alexandrium_andersonii.AAC.1
MCIRDSFTLRVLDSADGRSVPAPLGKTRDAMALNAPSALATASGSTHKSLLERGCPDLPKT